MLSVVLVCFEQLCEWILKVQEVAGIDLMDAASASASSVRNNVLLSFFEQGSESDASRATVKWKGGAHPSLTRAHIPEGVPSSADQVSFECIRWEDTEKEKDVRERRHVRYVVMVTAPGHSLYPYELPKRWQEISDLSKSLYQYDRSLPRKFRWQANGEKPLPTKHTSHNYDPRRLDKRQAEINAFFGDLSSWVNRLLGHPGRPIDLLDPRAQGDQHSDLISKFFSPGSTYDAAMDTVRDISRIGTGVRDGSQAGLTAVSPAPSTTRQ